MSITLIIAIFFLIVFTIPLGVIAIVFIDMFRSRLVPFVKTVSPAMDLVAAEMHLQPNQIVVELGCGDADMLSRLTQMYPGIRARGYEVGLIPYLQAKKRQKKDGNAYEVFKKSFLGVDLSDVQVFYCYLLPYLMSTVWKKIQKECKPGTLVYSYAFQIAGMTPERVVEFPETDGVKVSKLYIYQV